MNEDRLRRDAEIHGFAVENVVPMTRQRMTAITLVHSVTGANVLHLSCDDDENLFSITFPTPPPDDTGLPHILEHAVLAGSRQFPVREPFFEMAKMSMATFINAMTGWDATYYPVASNVRKDLFNLAEVYFDAVFNPLLAEDTFRREGYHLAPADMSRPDGDLTINGIVYSEMKGVFSVPESRLYRMVTRSLFPDSVYGRESGGDPDHIPDLTYDDFIRFHRRHYHPSNARFVLYGNIPTAEYLEFLDGRLVSCGKGLPVPPVTEQPRWSKPRSIDETYPINGDESPDGKTYLMMSWITGNVRDPIEMVMQHLLSLILLGNEAAPLRKAVIDSRLGHDMIHSGGMVAGLEMTFNVGLKGSEPDRADKFVSLVLDTLNKVAAERIDPERIDAAFQQSAYEYREILSSHPLHEMTRVLSGWLYGMDPLTYVRIDEHLEQCRQRRADDPDVFNNLIRRALTGNRHRLTAVLRPDRDWQSRADTALRERLAGIRNGLSSDRVRAIADRAAELERVSGTPNPPEALATLPQLKVGDLPPEPRRIPTSAETLPDGAVLLRNDVYAGGVDYLQIHLDLAGLPRDLWVYLPRYAEAIGKMGAAGRDYQRTAARIAGSTGGIDCWPEFLTHADDINRPVWGMRISMKTLDEQIDPALAALRDLLFSVDPRDSERMKDVMTQSRSHYRAMLLNEGSATAAHHAERGLTHEGFLSEMADGLPQLAMTRRICDEFDGNSERLMAGIERIRDFLLRKQGLTASFTGSDRAYDTARRVLSGWIGGMRSETPEQGPTGYEPFDTAPREGLAGAVQVAFCAQSMRAPHYSDDRSAILSVGARLVSIDHVLAEVRFKGNAYGAWFHYRPLSGLAQFGSYRDPHIARTFKTFARTPEFVHNAQWTQTDIDRAIIGTAKEAEKPVRPGWATGTALTRHVTGQTPDKRARRYAQMRSATPRKVKETLATVLADGLKMAPICIVAGRDGLEAARRDLPGGLDIRNIEEAEGGEMNRQ